MSEQIDINIIGATPDEVRLLACTLLLAEIQVRMPAVDAEVPHLCQSLEAIVQMLGAAIASQAPCAVRYALGAIVGAAATGELTRQEQGFTPLAEAMASASCPDCTALLRGEKPAESPESAVVH